MTHHVYTFWRDREPLYVGCTGNLPQRMAAHRGSAHAERANWVSVVPFEDVAEAFAAESALIYSLRPAFNTAGNPARMRVLAYTPVDTPESIIARKRRMLHELAAGDVA